MASAWVFIQIYVYALIQNPAAKWPVVRKSQTPAMDALRFQQERKMNILDNRVFQMTLRKENR